MSLVNMFFILTTIDSIFTVINEKNNVGKRIDAKLLKSDIPMKWDLHNVNNINWIPKSSKVE